MMARIAVALTQPLSRLLLVLACLATIWWLLVMPSTGVNLTSPDHSASPLAWGWSLLTGDWGYSRRTGEAVLDGLARRAPTTLLVGLLSVMLAAVMAWATMALITRHPGGALALLLSRLGRCLRATPAFVLAMALVSIFSYYVNWLPAVVLELDSGHPQAVLRALAMPVLTLSALYWARLLPRLGRVRDDVGYHYRHFVARHLAWAVSVLLIVDAVFALPGLGRWLVASARFADTYVVQGIAVACLMVLACTGRLSGRQGANRTAREPIDPTLTSAHLVPRLWLSVCWLVLVLTLCLFPTWLPLSDPDAIDLTRSHAPPGAAHWLGTDALGRDMLALLAHGGHGAVLVALSASAVGLLVGVGVGLVATGLRQISRRVGALVQDFLGVWPPIVVLMLLALARWPGGDVTFVLALALVAAPGFACVDAGSGRELSRSRRRLPTSRLLAEAVRAFARSLTLVALLGFMRLTPPEYASNWGAAMAQGREHLGYAPAMVWMPALMLWVTLVACQQLVETVNGEGALRR